MRGERLLRAVASHVRGSQITAGRLRAAAPRRSRAPASAIRRRSAAASASSSPGGSEMAAGRIDDLERAADARSSQPAGPRAAPRRSERPNALRRGVRLAVDVGRAQHASARRRVRPVKRTRRSRSITPHGAPQLAFVERLRPARLGSADDPARPPGNVAQPVERTRAARGGPCIGSSRPTCTITCRPAASRATRRISWRSRASAGSGRESTPGSRPFGLDVRQPAAHRACA